MWGCEAWQSRAVFENSPRGWGKRQGLARKGLMDRHSFVTWVCSGVPSSGGMGPGA